MVSSTPPDPLADLRSDDDAGIPGVTGPVRVNSTPGDATDEATSLRPMVNAGTHEAMVVEGILAVHQDLTCQGFLHGGGACGCRYIVETVLRTVVPVMTDDDYTERDLEPAGG